MIKESIKVTLLILLAAMLLGIMTIIIFNKKIFSFDFKREELLLSKDYTIEEINKIEIDVESADIIVYESETENLKVKIYGNDEKDFSVDNKHNELFIKSKKSVCIGICFGNEKIEVYVPTGYDKDIKITGESSDVVFNTSIIGNVDIETKSGDVSLRDVNNATLDLISGDIKINKASDVKLKTISGDITIEEVNNIDAETVSGDIKVSSINISKNGYIKSTSGNITIKNSNDVYFEANTVSGDIDINENNRLAEFVIKLKTTSGDISVK